MDEDLASPLKQVETAPKADGNDFAIVPMPSQVQKEEISPEEQAMKEQADKHDDEETTQIDKDLAELKKKSVFKKLMAYNNPKIFVYIGIFGALIAGSLQPGLGIILS